MTAFVSFAPAKINLFLHVGRPNPDGRHPIESLAAFASCGDTLIAAEADALSLNVDGPFAADLRDERDNLVLRAAHALAAHAGMRAPRAALRLTKALPVASGIGGGSADAAAALRALNELWRTGASQEDLRAIAAALGADVPACVDSTPCMMRGGGEVLSPAPVAELCAVLVNPRTPAATGDVYRAFDAHDLGDGFAAAPTPRWLDAAHALQSLHAMRNDLTQAAIAIAPEIAAVMSVLEEGEGARLVRMSGSGATCFALTESMDAAHALAGAIRAQRPAWWVEAARLGAVDVTPQAL
ncbi:MAG: 4-(cytidine 5'-diphospho)-2-C-methyl-D-erythritol kinase [Alphaproteobacteria bacterium]|nr:4-(cytidine 5'-diphospho)-2-C-methyl-D-erythritol kinase [Alphaproteobacteria bacterium]